MIIKVLSMWQPWASCVPHGIKGNETRSWKTNYRGWLAIHSTKSINKKAQILACQIPVIKRMMIDDGYQGQIVNLPLAKVVAVAELLDVIKMDEKFIDFFVSDDEKSVGDYQVGRYAWKFGEVYRIWSLNSIQGKQGLWDYDLFDRPLLIDRSFHYGENAVPAELVQKNRNGFEKFHPKEVYRTNRVLSS
jgi:hypothetical protein